MDLTVSRTKSKRNTDKVLKRTVTIKDIAAIVESALIIIAMTLLIFNPKTYMTAFSNGLIVFAANVLPSMFPYLFFTKLLTKLGLSEKLSKLLRRPLKIFNLPESAAFTVIMSFFCGYPMGAKLTSELYKEGSINVSQARSLSALTSLSGPIFIVGTLGSAIFNNIIFGWLLLSTNVLAAFLNGFLWRPKTYIDFKICQRYARASKLSDLTYDTVITVLVVGGYIALFNMLADMLSSFGVVDVLSRFLYQKGMISATAISDSVLYGIIEMTRGCLILSTYGANKISLAISAAIIAFGGLSATVQSITFLGECKVSVLHYLSRKLTQTVLAFFIGYLLGFLL